MKTLTTLMENFEKNPGNDIKLGVTNHLTPIGNIITNVRNFFGSAMQIVVEPGEDGVSLKLHSSRFINQEEIAKVLDRPYLGSTTLRSYICSQGLCNVKVINLGSYFVVYFGPNDIRSKENPDKSICPTCGTVPCACDTSAGCTCKPCACTEMLQYNLSECEIETISIVEGTNYDDEELEDKTKEQLLKYIEGTDKVKCAQKLAELLADDLDLPEDYYFKGVKDADGNESIALRFKFSRRRPFGKEVQMSRSLLNIYKVGEDAVWVEAFLDKDKNPDEMNRIIEAVLKLIGAKETDDPCVWAITPDAIDDLKGKEGDDEGEKKEEESEKKEGDGEENDDDLNKKEEGEEVSGSLSDDNESSKNE